MNQDSNGHDDNDVSDNHHLSDNAPNESNNDSSDNESNHVELNEEQFKEGLTSVANTLQDCSTLVNSMRLFNNLSDDDRASMIACMSVENFRSDQKIIEKGQMGTKFYIIMEGTAAIYDEGEDTSTSSILRPSEYFGGLALLLNKAHERSVRATSDLKCGVISEESFTKYLVPMVHFLEAKVDDYLAFTTSHV